jgi:hypothetical protein
MGEGGGGFADDLHRYMCIPTVYFATKTTPTLVLGPTPVGGK